MTGDQVDNAGCDLPGGDHLDYREGMTQTCTVMVPLYPLEGQGEVVIGILEEVIPTIVAGRAVFDTSFSRRSPDDWFCGRMGVEGGMAGPF